MKAFWKKKWVAALRSGKYGQAQGGLKKGDSYCCLGVLCKVASPTTRWRAYHGGDRYFFKGEAHMPPQSILDTVGLTRKSAERLANLNDSNETFKKIATIINKDY